MAKARSKKPSKKPSKKQAATPEPEPLVAEPPVQEETTIAVDEPVLTSTEAPAADISADIEQLPEKVVVSEDQEMRTESQAQGEAVQGEVAKEEESQASKLTLEERRAKMQQLRAKMVRLSHVFVQTGSLKCWPCCFALCYSAVINNRKPCQCHRRVREGQN